MFIYVYIYIYINSCVYIYIYIYICIGTYVCNYMYAGLECLRLQIAVAVSIPQNGAFPVAEFSLSCWTGCLHLATGFA